jgi:hypothetical protein
LGVRRWGAVFGVLAGYIPQITALVDSQLMKAPDFRVRRDRIPTEVAAAAVLLGRVFDPGGAAWFPRATASPTHGRASLEGRWRTVNGYFYASKPVDPSRLCATRGDALALSPVYAPVVTAGRCEAAFSFAPRSQYRTSACEAGYYPRNLQAQGCRRPRLPYRTRRTVPLVRVAPSTALVR